MKQVTLALAALAVLFSASFPAIADQNAIQPKTTLVAEYEKSVERVQGYVRICKEIVASMESRVAADQTTAPNSDLEKARRDKRIQILAGAYKRLERTRKVAAEMEKQLATLKEESVQ